MPFMDVISNFQSDFIDILRRELKAWQSDIRGLSDEEIQLGYFELCQRMIDPVPRTIVFSREFKCPEGCKEGLNLLVYKLQTGESVFPHLSRRIRKFKFHDGLLNCWGIQHLHLGTSYQSDGLIEGGPLILYGVFTSSHAYLLDIREHDWYQIDLLEIIRCNWPDLIAPFQYKHCLPSPTPPTVDDLRALRNKNINTTIQLGDGMSYFAPGGGTMANGMSFLALQRLQHEREQLSAFERAARFNPDQFWERFFTPIQPRPKALRLKLVAFGGYYFCAAVGSDVLLSIWPRFPDTHDSPEQHLLRRVRALACAARYVI
ncbi:hypothetical protein [Pseudomonas subflava]|uniref:hypothetical protein n=1 Tax=Pseudomonas subflava TaxID=2952933 RepID=UPI00207A6B92|nr:hypothetical protein [Pseudomonas subflava]